MFKTSFLFIVFLLQSILLCAQCYVFVGSYNWTKGDGIYVYKLDTLTGSLTAASVASDVLNPGFIALSDNGKYLYSCTEAHIAGSGKVSSFSFDPIKGALTFINEQPSYGENPVYLAVHRSGRLLINANYTAGSISAYRIDEDGRLGTVTQSIAFMDSSIDAERQRSAHIHAAVFSPGQDHIFFPDLGADKIRSYAIDTLAAQPLNEAKGQFVHTVPGSGPRHFVFHPNGKYAYCVEELSGCVSAYRYTDKRLDSIQRIAIHQHRRKGNRSSADIHISPDGQYLYASNRSKENNIAICAIDQESGRLSLIGYCPVEGDHPRMFALSPNGKFLLVANQVSNDVVVFRRNESTGLLKPAGTKVKVPGASCIQIRNYDQ